MGSLFETRKQFQQELETQLQNAIKNDNQAEIDRILTIAKKHALGSRAEELVKAAKAETEAKHKNNEAAHSKQQAHQVSEDTLQPTNVILSELVDKQHERHVAQQDAEVKVEQARNAIQHAQQATLQAEQAKASATDEVFKEVGAETLRNVLSVDASIKSLEAEQAQVAQHAEYQKASIDDQVSQGLNRAEQQIEMLKSQTAFQADAIAKAAAHTVAEGEAAKTEIDHLLSDTQARLEQEKAQIKNTAAQSTLAAASKAINALEQINTISSIEDCFASKQAYNPETGQCYDCPPGTHVVEMSGQCVQGEL